MLHGGLGQQRGRIQYPDGHADVRAAC